ncbi:Butyrophilin subfamily 1 member A1 [Galemys pyrenaicus]|uniref:Butyrophilin subfamily 1 member A1 n=1 Tax=Galemys pyrenaicus TaxID=202257 RepID=A0A8J6DGW0_GALPY|nr:Butyrophilin subfamily 1 member A1 [Galemys pyrenaicus]
MAGLPAPSASYPLGCCFSLPLLLLLLLLLSGLLVLSVLSIGPGVLMTLPIYACVQHSPEEMAPCSCPSSVLCLLPSLLLLQLPPGRSAVDFRVIGPTDPIVAALGRDIMLPCRVSPPMNVRNMEMRWFRSKFSEAAFVYANMQEQSEEQLPQYRGRTSLEMDILTPGKAALRIRSIQVSDNGKYTCFFRKDSFYEEAALELKVAGVGSAPQVHITGLEGDGVRVVCTASGWFPEPQVQWRYPSGEKFHEFSEVYNQDTESLFNVETSLVVRDSSAGNVTCSIINSILGQEKTMAIVLPEPFYPRASPWKPAFLVSLTLLLLLLLGAAWYTWREHSTWMQELQEERRLCQDKQEDRQTKEKALKDREKRKKAYLSGGCAEVSPVCSLSAWRKAQLYADWRKENFQPWSITLDPDSAHLSIVLSPDKKNLSLKNSYEDAGDTCSIVGLEGITLGHCYWEVEVKSGDKSVWTLGVCRNDVKRTGWYKETPEKGFWAVGHFESGFCACTSDNTPLSLRQNPKKLGIFLDYDQKDVSFYNMTDGSHIFSFSLASFSGTLLPYFMCVSVDVSMTLCPLEAGPSVLMNNPSLGEPVGPSGDGIPSGSSIDGAYPGPEAPLLP